MYVCLCRNVTEQQIRQAVNQGACTMRDLCTQTGACSRCGKCGPHAREVLQTSLEASSSTHSR